MNRIIFYILLSIFSFTWSYAQPSKPKFSHPHGLYNEPFFLTIECKDAQATIYFTTDGKAPTVENACIYTQPIRIEGTTVMRTMAIDESGTSKVNTATYIFLNDVLKQDNSPEEYPSEWGSYASRTGTAIADYEMDPEMTADEAFCQLLKKGFESIPIISVAMDPMHLFNKEENDSTGGIYIYTGAPNGGGQPGRGWERPVSFEIFDAKGLHDFQANCGIRIHGGHSRLPEKSPKHSFRLIFRDIYGPKKLNYHLFGEDEPANLNAIVLRTAFCNSWHHQDADQRKRAIYTRDMWAKLTQKEMGHITTNGMYTHLFINGLYWGMYNPTERIDDDFCEAHLGGDKVEYDVIKVEEYGTSHVVTADAGTLDKWYELFNLAEKVKNDMNAYYALQGLDEYRLRDATKEVLLNVDNFIDYMLINQYGGNSDWDSHNWLAVRNRIKADEGFHFICWDTEHILKSRSDNVLSKNTKLSPTGLFQYLMKNQAFKHHYIDRVQKHCFDNGILTPARNAHRWLTLDAIIDTALYCEQARWGDYRRDVHAYTTQGELYTKDIHYNNRRKVILESYFPERTDKFVQQLKDLSWFPQLTAPVILYANEPAYLIDTLSSQEALTIDGEGDIYYTTNGDNPVSWFNGEETGELSPSAIKYKGEEIKSDTTFTLKTIAFANKQWSAMREQYIPIRETASSIVNMQADNILSMPLQVIYDHEQMAIIRFKTTHTANATLHIYNMQGLCIHTLIPNNQRLKSGLHQYPLDTAYLPSGIYLCRLTIDGKSSVIKLKLQ
jgi:hypothetical protein